MSQGAGGAGLSPCYSLLGSPRLTAGDGRPIEITPGRQQAVASLLLLEANRVVSTDKLVDALWEDDPPSTARTQVQICVSRLRHTFGLIGRSHAIVTRAPGYLVLVEPGELDVDAFDALLKQADAAAQSGDLDHALTLLDRAQALWRGPALDGVRCAAAELRAAHLDERRQASTEFRMELELRRGRHATLIADLSRMVAEHPLRERLRGQLMLALHRCGRRAEALQVYREGRQLMVDNLGLEPGPELRALEAAILAGHPDGESPGGESAPAAGPSPTVPRQLPSSISDFTGRLDLIDQMESWLIDEPGSTVVITLTGKPGVGKSSLALQVAHELAAQYFPDGQLFGDLRGTSPQPATASEILRRFLVALGIEPNAIPEPLDERAELYRQVLATKRVCIVLDDAANEAQITPLIPGAGRSALIVTGRTRLTGLPGGRFLEVDVLPRDEALTMLSRVIGRQRVDAEPEAAAALIELVGALPLALRIVAARLKGRRHWSLAWMRERLTDESRLLDELAHGDLMVRASISLSYDALPERPGELLTLLGALDRLAFPTWVAAALLDSDMDTASVLLEVLVDAQMIEVVGMDPTGGPRFQVHDLILAVARERLGAPVPAGHRRAAVARVAGGWLAAAEAAHQAAYGGDFTVLHGGAARWPVPASCLALVTAPDPLRWMEYEYENFLSAIALSAQHGLTELCWDLAVTLVTLFEARCLFEGWERTHRQAIRALQLAGSTANQRGLAALFCSMGSLHLARNEHSAAENSLASALAGFEATADVLGQAMTLRNLALVERAQHAPERALARLHSALRGFRQVNDEIGDVHCLGLIAQVELENGDAPAAREHLTDALERCRRVGNVRVETQLRYRLAQVLVLEGRPDEAADALEELLLAVRAHGDEIGETYVLRLLDDVVRSTGQPGVTGRPLDALAAPPAAGAFERIIAAARTGADHQD